ncbi:hypothetical protein ACT8ZV_07640 [Nocardioides sp. MAHUQ-72]|uniref:hypothetical protein n=1 Tax=unclassified Nocardioides TaxID=2615069 RepID=UPI00360BA749
MVLFVALASAWVLGTSGGDETLTADPSDRDVTPSAAPTPAPSGTPSPTLGEEPPPAPAAPSETTRTDAECKQLMDDLVLDQGLPSAVAYPTLRQEGCGVWLDEQLAAAQTAQP